MTWLKKIALDKHIQQEYSITAKWNIREMHWGKNRQKKSNSYQINCSFSSIVLQSCPVPFNPLDCSMPRFPVPHHFLAFVQVHVHCIGDAVQPSHPLMPSSPSALNLSQHQGLFQWVVSITDDQNTGASASASVLPVNIQGWSPLRLTGLILLFKGLSGVFSSTAVQRLHFFGTLPSLQPSSQMWPVGRP